MTPPNTLSLGSLARASTLANHIILPTRAEVLIIEHGDLDGQVRSGSEYTEMRLHRDGRWLGPAVTIRRPESRYGRTKLALTEISWSSSSTNEEGVEPAEIAMLLLTVAVETAKLLDRWAVNGELEYLELEQ